MASPSGHQNFELMQFYPVLVDSEDSLFSDGFATPWRMRRAMDVPWSTVEEFMSMAKHALHAKQQTVEVRLELLCCLRLIDFSCCCLSCIHLCLFGCIQALLQQVEEHAKTENASELLQRVRAALVASSRAIMACMTAGVGMHDR